MPVKQAIKSYNQFMEAARTALSDLGRVPNRPRPRKDEFRSEQRWLSHAQVGLYFLADGQLEEATANLVDKSDSGVRLWTSRTVQEGDCFLLLDQHGNEGEAVTAWARPDSDGTLLGARVAWVGAVLHRPPSTTVAAALQAQAAEAAVAE